MPRATTLRALPKAENGLQCEGELCEVRRRLHCYRHLERIARTRNQTFGRTVYEGARTRTLTRKKPLSRTSKTASTFWAKTYASTEGSSSSNHPERMSQHFYGR